MASDARPSCGADLSPGEMKDGWCGACGKRLPGAFSARPAAREAPEGASPGPTLGASVYRKGNDPAGRPGALGWGAARAGLGLGVAGCVFLLLHFLALAAVGPATWQAPL